MAAEVDWDASLANWERSGGAQDVPSEERAAVARALDWLGDNYWDKIEFFEKTLESKKVLDADGLCKNEVLQMASKQLLVHKTLHRTHVHQEKYGMRTYEMPFAAAAPILRYLKVQLKNARNLHDPSKIEIVYIRYHENIQKLGVVTK